jgi:hypothetical protein
MPQGMDGARSQDPYLELDAGSAGPPSRVGVTTSIPSAHRRDLQRHGAQACFWRVFLCVLMVLKCMYDS